MQLQLDERGFIIGENRLKEIAQGISHTEDNTKNILSILSKQFEDLRKEASYSNELQSGILKRLNREGHSKRADVSEVEIARKISHASNAGEVELTRIINAVSQDATTYKSDVSNVSTVSERVKRERDQKGRFVGLNSSRESGEGTIFNRIKMPDLNGVNVGGVDPTIDALTELKEVVGPVGRVFGGMGARAVSIFRGRAKKRRNEQVLPEEQVKANKVRERQDKQRNKLLERLINVVAVSGSGRGIGLLGGLLGGGKGLKGGLVKLLRKLPIVGALIGGGAVASNWSKSSSGEKGKGIGSVIGMGVGGALGSILGIGGTVAGGAFGSYLGGIFGEKVGKWTESLEKQNLGETLKGFLSGSLERLTLPLRQFGTLYKANSIFGGYGKSSGSSGDASSSGSGPKAVGKLSADKAKTISRVANNIGVDPNDLASIISFETGGTFSPSVKNPKSSATGLLQFMSGSGGEKGKYYGMTRDQFSGLSFDEQMKYVERYYKDRGFDGKTKRSLADAYTAVSGYGYKKGSKEYELNKVWDTDKDGYISKGEAVASKNFQQHNKQWIQPELTKSLPNAKGAPYSLEVINGQQKASKPIKVPPITPERTKIKTAMTASASKAPSDVGISQIVSDRSLAHIFAGSIGFDQHNA